MALALARCSDAHYSTRHHPISVYRTLPPAAFLPGINAARLATTTHFRLRHRSGNGRVCHFLSCDLRRPLVSLANTRRSRAAKLLLPVHQWAGRRTLFSRLPTGSCHTVDGLDPLGLAWQARPLLTSLSPWPGGAG